MHTALVVQEARPTRFSSCSTKQSRQLIHSQQGTKYSSFDSQEPGTTAVTASLTRRKIHRHIRTVQASSAAY